MSDEVYRKLAEVLDTLPNGFPATESGIELKLLKKIFDPDEAEFFPNMKLSFETAEQIAERTGRQIEELSELLDRMAAKGQIRLIQMGDVKVYRMYPWIFGIFEFQMPHMDREMGKLHEEYYPVLGKKFFSQDPPQFMIIPVEKEIQIEQEALPYEKVSNLVENSQAFAIMTCICKKEKRLTDKPCDRSESVCMAFAPVPGIFDGWDDADRKPITKEEARRILDEAEEAGLVHLTHNMQNGLFYICNCCKCCCAVLGAINRLGVDAGQVVNSHYYAQIEEDECSACGICADDRCQVGAIEEVDDYYHVVREKCIGCGLCISACPTEAMSLFHKSSEEHVLPPVDEATWFEERGRIRGVDYSQYK